MKVKVVFSAMVEAYVEVSDEFQALNDRLDLPACSNPPYPDEVYDYYENLIDGIEAEVAEKLRGEIEITSIDEAEISGIYSADGSEYYVEH